MTAAARFRVEVGGASADAGQVRLRAIVGSPALGTRELWFEVDDSHDALLTNRADPFVLATLLLAMQEGLPLEVTGAEVDATLLRRLREFQRVWEAWFGYTAVPIEADVASDDRGPERAVVAFSGGADSAFSAWWHVRGEGGDDPPLRGTMTIRGIDIPLADPDGFTRAATRARLMIDSLGLDPVVVATNAWTLPVPIAHYTGMGVAAALHVVGGGYGTGLVPSTAAYAGLVVPMNSSPVSDWLLGGSAFAIAHDAARFNRFEKLRVLAEWPEAMQALRVCLEDPRHDRNCGECHKCMMTQAAFRVLGIAAPCFATEPTPDALAAWARHLPSAPYYQQEGLVLVDAARARGVAEPWVRVLRNRIRVAQLKDGVRAAWPSLARDLASAHRRVSEARAKRR